MKDVQEYAVNYYDTDFPEDVTAAFAGITEEEILSAALANPMETLEQELRLRKVSTAELCAVLGITDRRISQLWKDGIIPEPTRNGNTCYFSLLQSVSAYIRFMRWN